MRFGRYKGDDLRAVPKYYLKWLQTIELDNVMKRAVEAVLDGLEPPTWYGVDRPRWTPGTGDYVVFGTDGTVKNFDGGR